MRREDFELDASQIGWVDSGADPAQPTVTIDFHGEATQLRERLSDGAGGFLDADETDVAFRLRESDEEPPTGVVAVTDRLTGDFVFELNVDADDVFRFVEAAREYGKRTGDTHYRVVIHEDGEELLTYEKDTFLVYNEEGDLLRSKSVIPSGVEL